jgi:tetratricopeptide (TPR) repeat protein
MDLDNPVVKLCAQGMQAETEGRAADAHALFREAWYAATDDYEACVASHYLARHQNTPKDTLRWNQECLDRADRVDDERVRGFYPSLHLNMARAHAELGDNETARKHYQSAAECLENVPAGPYRDGIRFAVAAGLRSTGLIPRKSLPELLDRLCARADLMPLGLLLPHYLGDLGTPEDRITLLTAMQMVHAGRSLPDEDQELLRRAIRELT